MRVSQVISRVRDIIGDQGSSTFTDAELARHLDTAIHTAFRWQMQADSSYHNCSFTFSASQGVQTAGNLFTYQLPRWVKRVQMVRLDHSANEELKEIQEPADWRHDGTGFRLDRLKSIQLYGYASAQNLRVWAAKVPARLLSGTCPADGSTTLLKVPTTGSTYELENEVDGYKNAIFEMTGLTTAGRDPVGQIRRIESSSRVQESGTTYHLRLVPEVAFTVAPLTSDTFEMHPEIDDDGIGFIVYRAARAAFQRIRNNDGLGGIASSLAEETERFISTLQPRQSYRPAFWNTDADDPIGIENPDRSPFIV